jgi:prevent-host-death family protein
VKRVSIRDLKKNLSSVIDEAEAGGSIVVTRHNDVVAVLGPARPRNVHRGAHAGSGARLRPAVKLGSKGRYLTVLLEDRGEP